MTMRIVKPALTPYPCRKPRFDEFVPILYSQLTKRLRMQLVAIHRFKCKTINVQST